MFSVKPFPAVTALVTVSVSPLTAVVIPVPPAIVSVSVAVFAVVVPLSPATTSHKSWSPVFVLLLVPVISLVNATVPSSFCNVIVLSAVGSTTVKVVSCPSEVAPSKITELVTTRLDADIKVCVPATSIFSTFNVPVLGL